MKFKQILFIHAMLLMSLYGQDTIRVDMTINLGYEQQLWSGGFSIPKEELKHPVQRYAPDSILVEIVKSEALKGGLRILLDANTNKTLVDDKPIHLQKDSVVVVTVQKAGHFQPSRMLKYLLSYSFGKNREGLKIVNFQWRSHYRAEGKITLNNKEYLIAVLDSDGNGVFDKKDFRSMSSILFDANSDGAIWGENEYFLGDQILPFGENNLLIRELSKDGSYIVFEKTDLKLPSLKDRVPEFKVPAVSGEFLSNENLLGKNYVLVFWASWCAPCVKSLPELIAFSNRYPETVRFISLNVDLKKDVEKAEKIVSDYKINWTQVMTGKGREDELWKLFRSGKNRNGIPLYALVDSKGFLQYYGNGGKKLKDLEQAILALQ